MGEEIALQSSPDTGWSTGAIPLTSSVAAQNPAPPQTEKHRRSNVPGKPPFTRSIARLLPQEPELQNPSASKTPAKGKIRMNERADQSVSNNPRAKTTTELDFVAPADDLSNQPCAVGNWTGTTALLNVFSALYGGATSSASGLTNFDDDRRCCRHHTLPLGVGRKTATSHGGCPGREPRPANLGAGTLPPKGKLSAAVWERDR
jgi:hypothetical protein